MLVLVGTGSTARAEGPGPARVSSDRDKVAAQSLFYQARALMAQGRYAAACPKLEASQKLDRGIGTMFNLADCNEHLGNAEAAWAGFVEVATLAKGAGQTAREKVARQRAQALESRLARLVVEVEGPQPGLEVRRDGAIVAPATWGTPVPVEPGPHRITASAPGRQAWEANVSAAEGRIVRVTVKLPPSPAPTPTPTPTAVASTTNPGAPNPATPPPPPPPPGPEVQTTETTNAEMLRSFPEPAEEPTGDTQRAIGFIAGGLGVATLAVGAGFGLASLDKRDGARPHCTGDTCDAIGFGLRQDAIRDGNVATITLAAGGVALLGGVVLVLTAPRGRRHTAARLEVVPRVGSNGGGLVLQGSVP